MRLYVAMRKIDALSLVAIDDLQSDLKDTMKWLNLEGDLDQWEVNSPQDIFTRAKSLVTQAKKETVLILMDDHLPIEGWGQQIAVGLCREGYFTAIISGSADPGPSAEVHKQASFLGWYHPKKQQKVALISMGLNASRQVGEIDKRRDRWGLFEIPHRLEAYFDIMLKLAFDNKVGAVETTNAYASTIEDSVSDADAIEWESLKKTILDWDMSKRETNIVDLNDQLLRFAEKELIDHYPYLGEIE